MNVQEFKLWSYNQHDIVCNQKYDKILPYSQHLKYVDDQFNKFKYILKENEPIEGKYIYISGIVMAGCAGHDLIEDARVTYNDIKDLIGKDVADIIYCCTEEKGRNRDERHDLNYYSELGENKLAIFVKLCDILANVKYSILTNSSMYNKHKKEHTKTREFLYIKEYDEMFAHLDKLFELQ